MLGNKRQKLERVHKLIADSGYCSRRKAETLMSEGQVLINGEVVKDLGTKVDPAKDQIVVNGTEIETKGIERAYIVMNKPRGYITSAHDPEGRPTVLDICRDIPQRIFPVGRLDFHSEGLLILTNDGDLANKIIHPRSGIVKVYDVKVFGVISEDILQTLRAGLRFGQELIRPLSVRIVKTLPKKTWLEFKIVEGKNREIRRFCEGVGLTIDKLKRVSIGGLSVEGIPLGTYKIISKQNLINLIGLDTASTNQYGIKKYDRNPRPRDGANQYVNGNRKDFNLGDKNPAPRTRGDYPQKSSFSRDEASGSRRTTSSDRSERFPQESKTGYRSFKRSSVPYNGKRQNSQEELTPRADDKTFYKFRKRHYQDTMTFYKNKNANSEGNQSSTDPYGEASDPLPPQKNQRPPRNEYFDRFGEKPIKKPFKGTYDVNEKNKFPKGPERERKPFPKKREDFIKKDEKPFMAPRETSKSLPPKKFISKRPSRPKKDNGETP